MTTEQTIIPKANDMRGALARGVNQATDGAHERINSMSAAAQPTLDRMASGAHDAVDRVAGAATQAAQTLDATSEKLKTANQRLAKNAGGVLRDHPVASLGVAVAAGFVLSRLFASR